jgi:hypothetical protein
VPFRHGTAPAVIDLSGPHRFGAVVVRRGEVTLDVMDDMQRDVAQEPSPATSGEARETITTVLGTARLLANPRRVRRA